MNSMENELYGALLDIIRLETTPEAVAARNLILRRIALEGDVVPSRIEAPRNITQIGGYINLLDSVGEGDLKARMLASILGISAPGLESGLCSAAPSLFFAARGLAAAECAQAESLPIRYTMRSDFVDAFDALQKTLRQVGGVLPVLTRPLRLPPLHTAPPTGRALLALLGRTLDIAPTAVLQDVEDDPVLLAKVDGETLAAVYCWTPGVPQNTTCAAYQRDSGGTVITRAVTGKFTPVRQLLAAAGWHPDREGASDAPESALRWRNVTGLVPGVTTLREELSLLYTPGQIVESCLRDCAGAVWNGTAFA